MSSASTDDNQSTVRIDDEKNTVRLENDDSTVKLGSGAIVNPVMGNMPGIMPQQDAKIDTTASANTGEVFTPGQVIDINGKNCTIESLISMSSGEAVIYKINMDGKSVVLKYYNPGNSYPEAVLSKIKANPKSRVINLLDYGRRNNQDFEIMEYAEGGTLDQYLKDNGPIRDVEKLKNIVGQITEGLEQLHNELNIVYQDLKPENIYFKDVNKTSLILADFGISSVMKQDEKMVEVLANATTVYAAPDLARIGNNKTVKIGTSVDYFALGITMLQLWLGERPFCDIPESERVRQIRDKAVEFPKDMESNYKSLIQGLIMPLPNDRWGNQQIKKWLAGETLKSNYQKTIIAYEKQMFNETESYSSPAELAALMEKYPDRAKIALYSDIVRSWLQNSGNNLLYEEIKDVISVYSEDKDVGLFYAIYKLDSMKPFKSRGGKICSNLVEIADAIKSESDYYMEELKNPNAKLYLYIEAVEGSNGKVITDQLRKNFEEYSPKRALNLMYLRFQLDGGKSITIGAKTYQDPEEIAAETDNAQISLIKFAIWEEDSLFLVWLSDRYGEYFKTTFGFNSPQTKTQDRFFLLKLFPFLSFKEYIDKWEKVAVYELINLIHYSPGRFDLFEEYVRQGLTFTGQTDLIDWHPTALGYLTRFFNDITDIDTGTKLIRFLLDHGSDINEESGDGSAPIINAVIKRYVPLVKLLLELGANPNKTYNNIHPLFLAIQLQEENEEEEKRIAIANLLLDYKADVNKVDSEDRIILNISMYFESQNKVALISRFIDAGADFNRKDKEGNTSLMFAAFAASTLNNKQSALAVMELLLNKGAKTDILKNTGNFSPLMIAADQNGIEAAQLLLKYGAKKEFADIYANTAFIYAAQKNHTQIMALLDPGPVFKLKSRLFSLIKVIISFLAISTVFFTMDVLARIVLTLHLNYPVLLGVSILFSHLLTAYLLIIILGFSEYLVRLRGTFNFIGRSLQYIIGVPVFFPLTVLLLQFLIKFLPPNMVASLSFMADVLTRNSKTMAIGYIILLAAIMAVSIFVSKFTEKAAKQWQIYKQYSIK
jgi:serine/threonine protein kinase/ankyrin repeat protein